MKRKARTYLFTKADIRTLRTLIRAVRNVIDNHKTKPYQKVKADE
jgi:hypothetical protein